MDDTVNTPNDIDEAPNPEEQAERPRMELFDWLQCVLTALLIAVLLFLFVGRIISVEGISMERTLVEGDRVVASNLFYTPRNGDIIVFHSPTERFDGTPLVKRVIAVSGQEIDIDFDAGHVFLDGNLLDEPYINNLTTSGGDFAGPVYIPDGYVFVMGDNRGFSTDSRNNSVGLVDTRYILGRVLMIMVPGAADDGNRDWNRFGAPG